MPALSTRMSMRPNLGPRRLGDLIRGGTPARSVWMINCSRPPLLTHARRERLQEEVRFARDSPLESWREMDSNYQYAGTVNVDDDAVARDIVRVAAAMAASARLARSVRVRTTQPSRRPHLSCERTLALVGISGRVTSGRADLQQTDKRRYRALPLIGRDRWKSRGRGELPHFRANCRLIMRSKM
jgi:hypothetical protein